MRLKTRLRTYQLKFSKKTKSQWSGLSNAETREFLGLDEKVEFMAVRGSLDEFFFKYGFDKDKSKVLYSQYSKRIPNSFSRTIFNRHRVMIETSQIDSEFWKIYIFLPWTTNRTGDIKKYLKNVSISPIDISQK